MKSYIEKFFIVAKIAKTIRTCVSLLFFFITFCVAEVIEDFNLEFLIENLSKKCYIFKCM